MNPVLTFLVEQQAALDALDAVQDRARARVKVASKDTADAVHREALSRIPRRTGETASHLVVEETHDTEGYVVWVEPDVRIALHTNPRTGRQHTQKVSYNALGGWLEFGTVHMEARPFLFISARLEEARHVERVEQAMQDASDDSGLGD